MAIHLCGLPEGCSRRSGRAAHAFCSTLLRVGFAEPPGSLRTLVRSYRTVSPLPPIVGGLSLLHCPSGHPDLALASTLPNGVPTFLDTVVAVPRPPGRLTVGPQARPLARSAILGREIVQERTILLVEIVGR